MTVVRSKSRWIHKKTGRPVVVERGNEPKPAYVLGAVLGDQPGERVVYKYTDRDSRVMPCDVKVVNFLKVFAEAK